LGTYQGSAYGGTITSYGKEKFFRVSHRESHGTKIFTKLCFYYKNLVVFILDVSLANPNNLTNILSSFFLYCNRPNILTIKTRYSKSMNQPIKKERNSIYCNSNRWFDCDFDFSRFVFKVIFSYIHWVPVEFITGRISVCIIDVK
jgi:hypothetical protein